MKRLFDFLVALGLGVVLSPLILAVAALVRLTSPGPALFHTQRVGRNNVLFTMYKFRTMRTDTPQLATHLLENPAQFLSPIGALAVGAGGPHSLSARRQDEVAVVLKRQGVGAIAGCQRIAPTQLLSCCECVSHEYLFLL